MILNRYERMIAKRYLLPGKGEGFIFLVATISLAAVALSVATLIIVMSVMNGFRAELFEKTVGLNGHAVIQGYDGRLSNWQEIAEAASKTPGVTSAVPLIEQPLMASANGRVEGVLVRAIAELRTGREISIRKTIESALPRINVLSAAGLLASLGIIGGLILLIVPGLVLLTFWSMIIPVIILENAGVISSFSRSRELVSGKGWNVFAVIVLTFAVLLGDERGIVVPQHHRTGRVDHQHLVPALDERQQPLEVGSRLTLHGRQIAVFPGRHAAAATA